MGEPEIKKTSAIKMVGIKVATSLAADKTSLLWQRFMKLRGGIKNASSKDLYSVQVYGKNFMTGDFDTDSIFEKWAGMSVTDHDTSYKILENLVIPQGLYAVFTHHGTAKKFADTSKYIFENWLPASEYRLANRPHFEVLGSTYKGPENPDSEEHIWIPIEEK
ncbi:MAG: GyrI-like domain-containing protein [Christiangramia sp.]|uniref:GyrI-like domain-containing protein n=1 Tax=Christiangramia sp. TaxID=1931228 RepID=UPI003241CEE7